MYQEKLLKSIYSKFFFFFLFNLTYSYAVAWLHLRGHHDKLSYYDFRSTHLINLHTHIQLRLFSE